MIMTKKDLYEQLFELHHCIRIYARHLMREPKVNKIDFNALKNTYVKHRK